MSKKIISSEKGYLLSNGEIVSVKPKFNSRSLHLQPVCQFTDDDMTQQQFKDECDINNILKRFETTGELPDVIKSNPSYGDFSDVPTYLDALKTVSLAETQFSLLSSRIRAQFDNDPQLFLQFATDPANGDEMVKMGLSTRPVPTPEPLPQKVIVVDPAAPKSDAKTK